MAENRDIVTLSDVEHILVRPATYLGSMEERTYEEWILNDDKLELKPLHYSQALHHIIVEIIDNSVDEYIRTDGKYANKISVDIDSNRVKVSDNGRGIKVEKTSEGEWMPLVAFTKPRSGSNFSDEGRNTTGMNGLGSKATSIFSKHFEAITCDGKKRMRILCKDNLSSIKSQVTASSEKSGTTITFQPDFERFKVSGINQDIILSIQSLLGFMSWFYPKCTFTFNGRKLGLKAKDMTSLFPEHSVVLNEPNAYICIYPTDEPRVLTYVNGMYLSGGGSHIDYLSSRIVSDIREKIGKKYKNIKPADIRNRIGIVALFKGFQNCQFDSQTKCTLTNSQADITNFLKANDIDLDKFSARILREKALLDNITEIYRLKEELAEKKAINNLNKKSRKEFESEKYFPPIGRSSRKYLMLTEGYSAFTGISPVLGRKDIGYYSLRGKVLNIMGMSPKKFMENKEINDLVNILGIDLTDPDTDMNYERVVILTDADNDGNAICGLLLVLFSRIAPRMLKEGRICRLETPLLIGLKGDKVVECHFTFPDHKDMKPNLKYFYLKGLGSWTKSRLDQVLDMYGGLDSLITSYTEDDLCNASIERWFSSDTGKRKDVLRGREFHIDKV